MPVLTFEGVFGGPVGTCRYNPPTQDCTWPIVLEVDWCGKFEYNPRADPAPEECAVCRYFSDDKILGQHPAVSA